MKHATVSRALICLAIVLLWSSVALAEAICDRPIVSGWEAWEPFQYSRDGKLSGFDIEVLEAVFTDLGCKLEFREIPWTRHLEELKKGQIDIAPSATQTAERTAYGIFSKPYRYDEVRLWVRTGEAENWPLVDLAELAASEFRLGVSRSYVYGPVFAGLLESGSFKDDNLIQVDGEAQLFPMLARKRIDGLLAERTFVAIQVRDQSLQGQFEAHPIAVSSDPASFLFSRKSISDEFLAAFDQSLEKLKEDGTIARLEAKYLN